MILDPDKISAIADSIALVVLNELEGRGGFDAWWEEIDRSTQREIVLALSKAAERELKAGLS